VIDGAELLDGGQYDAKFFVQFAADSLLGAFTFLDTAAGRLVKDSADLRISDFRDEERIFVPD
jgi:hypothetical protein